MTSKPIALITGANKGLGYALASKLAQEHNFHVLLGCRNSSAGNAAAAPLQAQGLSIEVVGIDLASTSSIQLAAKEIGEKHGRLDVLVNNAGIQLDDTVTGELDDVRRMYQDTFNTNVTGTAIVTEAVLPLLSKSSLPRILFLTSTLGSISTRANPNNIYDAVELSAYRCSKAALNMLCLNYAKQYREKGWKINTACPGYVKTDFNRGGGMITVEEAMPNLVRLCVLGEGGESGTFSDGNGAVGW